MPQHANSEQNTLYLFLFWEITQEQIPDMHKGHFSISSYQKHPQIFHGGTRSYKEIAFFRQKKCK